MSGYLEGTLECPERHEVFTGVFLHPDLYRIRFNANGSDRL